MRTKSSNKWSDVGYWGPRLPSTASAWNGSYRRISCRHWDGSRRLKMTRRRHPLRLAIFSVREKAKGGLTVQFAKPLLAAFALGSMIALPAHAELDVASLKQSIEASFESEYPKLDALYKDIHAHPEIAFQEEKTAAKLAAEMRAIGFEVTEKVAKTGLVALYKHGDGPTIMVRTELDALPMEEKTGLPYASLDKTIWQGRETFVTHSCGHDIDMASWAGTAKTLVALKDQWKGTLMFIAQPAEDVTAGAIAMPAAGLI